MRRLFFVCTWLLLAGTAAAQPMLEKVPADAAIYVGWRGIDQADQAYQGSHLKGVLEAVKVGSLIDNLFAAKQAQQAQQADAPDPQQVKQALQAAWSRPWGFWMALPETAEGMPRFQLTIDGGDNADQLEALARQFQEKAQAQRVPGVDKPEVQVVRDGATIIFQTADADAADGDRLQLAEGLGADAQAVDNPMLYAWYDVAGFLEKSWRFAEADAPENAQPDIQAGRQIFESLGLDGIERGWVVSGFQGQNWATQATVIAPAPRRGLLTLVDQPIGQDLLELTPASATTLQAWNFDLAKFVQTIRQGVAQNPEASAQFEQSLAMGSGMLGMDLEQFFAAMGARWLTYTDPATVGVGGLGMAVVSPLRDVETFQQGLDQVHNLIREQLQAQGGDAAAPGGPGPAPGEPNVQLNTIEQDGLSIHTIPVMIVSPAWAVADGRFFFALTPQAVASAVDYARDQENSVLDQPAFQEARQQVDADQITAIQYMNLPETAPLAYQQFVMISQMLQGFTGQQNQMALPPLGRILPHLEPAIGVSWTDDQGWHARSVTPFPGASMLSGSVMSAPTLMPVLGGAFFMASKPMMHHGPQQHRQQGMQAPAEQNEPNQPPAAPGN